MEDQGSGLVVVVEIDSVVLPAAKNKDAINTIGSKCGVVDTRWERGHRLKCFSGQRVLTARVPGERVGGVYASAEIHNIFDQN